MSLTVTKRPAAFVAALSPVVYRMQRKDYTQWTSIDNDGGFVRINFNGINLSSQFNDDDQLYIKSSSGAFDEFGNITDVEFTGGNTKITTDIVYHATTDGTTVNDFVNNMTTRPVYNVAINLYDADTDDALLDHSLSYSPNLKGEVKIDVQSISALVSPEIVGIGGYDVVVVDENKSIGFYIGYTEQWIGSAEAETLDDTHTITAIFGEFTVVGRNDYAKRIPELILSMSDVLRLFPGKYFDISVYGVNTGKYMSIEHYNVSNELESTEYIQLKEGVIRVPILPSANDKKILAAVASNLVFIIPASAWNDIPTPFTKTTTQLTIVGGTGTDSYGAYMALGQFDANNFNDFEIQIQVIGSWSGSVTFLITASDGFISRQEGLLVSSNGNYTLKLSTASSITPAGPLQLTISAAISVSGAISATITIPIGEVLYSAPNASTAVKEIEVKSPCKNPITLSWCNIHGGQEWWTFDFNQEESYSYPDNTKVRRITLFANDLTFDQWRMLNGLNTLGDVFSPYITELDYDVIGTEKRIDSQVYLLLDNLGLLEVIVIPLENVTQTKRGLHAIQIQIELPEGYEENNYKKSFTSDIREFEAELDVDTDNPLGIGWNVRWYDGLSVDLEGPSTFIEDTKQLPLIENPMDIKIRVRKITNNGIAEKDGTIEMHVDGIPIGANTSFSIGDDVSDILLNIPKTLTVNTSVYVKITEAT